MSKELGIKNPFLYNDTKSMLVWKIAQTCIWMMEALWRDHNDIEAIEAALKQIKEAVKSYNSYKEGQRSVNQ